jgi:ABC-type uncharacterized transport system substrate-binding protein
LSASTIRNTVRAPFQNRPVMESVLRNSCLGPKPARRCVSFRGPVYLILLAAACVLFSAQQARAHPHMFIDVMVKFMLNDTALVGFYVYWDFDEMNSAMLIDDFDRNRNGRFEQSESDTVEREAFAYSANSNYFTALTWDKKLLKVHLVSDFLASIQGKSIVRYSFYVPCDIALEDIAGKEVSVFFHDPSIFVAFELKKNLIQVSAHERWDGAIRFGTVDYVERIILTIRRKGE